MIRGQLPYGVKDLFFEFAAQKRALEARLREMFTGWAYDEIIPPTLEYADVVAGPAGSQLAGNMMRFVDRDGQTLALRPDLTIPTARAVGTKLYDQALPLRLFYVGNVFRYEEPQTGRPREFTQAGFELIGAGSVAADGEVVHLAVEALRASGLRDFQVTIGHMGFFRNLLAALALPETDVDALTAAIDRKRQGELITLLQTLSLTSDMQRALRALPRLSGGAEVFARAGEVCLNEAMTQAVTHLHEVWQHLEANGLTQHVAVDFGEIRGMAYYTGLTFEGFAPGVGSALCNGGRYDDLIGHFGPSLPAVGCALVIETVLQAARQQGSEPQGRAPDWLVGVAAGCAASGLQAWIAGQRARGRVVDVDLLARDERALATACRARGIPNLLWYAEPGRVVVSSAAGARTVLPSELAAVGAKVEP